MTSRRDRAGRTGPGLPRPAVAPVWRTLRRIGPPSSLLARLRWSFLVFALFFVVTFVPQLTVGSDRDPWQQALAVVVLVVLGAWYLRCYRTARFPLPGLALELVAFVLVVVTPEDPYRALGLLYIAVNFRALYGSWRHVLAFTTLALAAFAGSVVLVAQSGGPDRVDLLAQSLPGVPVLAVIAHLAAVACEVGERAAARERVLSSSGTAIALARSAADVEREAVAAVQALAAGTEGVSAWVSVDVSHAVGPGPHADTASAAALREAGTVEQLLLPLRTHGNHVGHLGVGSPSPLPAELHDALETLAAQVAMGLSSARLVADLRHRATHDSLTGVANRSVLQERLEAALPARGAREVALLLLDLDGFKTVNDTLGHRAGDTVLQAAARRLLQVVGESDLVVRLGGDEFVILVDRQGAADAAARLVATVTSTLTEPVRLFDGSTVRVGASVGVAVAAADTLPHDLLGAADAAMYRVKCSPRRLRAGSRGSVPPPARVGAG